MFWLETELHARCWWFLMCQVAKMLEGIFSTKKHQLLIQILIPNSATRFEHKFHFGNYSQSSQILQLNQSGSSARSSIRSSSARSSIRSLFEFINKFLDHLFRISKVDCIMSPHNLEVVRSGCILIECCFKQHVTLSLLKLFWSKREL